MAAISLPPVGAAVSAPLTAASQMPPGIVVLTGGGPLPWIIINAVIARFGALTVLLEDQEPMRLLFRRRLKKLGAIQVAGQVAFGICQRALRARSRERLARLLATHQLETEPSPAAAIVPIGSVNAEACRLQLRQLAPVVILVVGTRMIGRATLTAVPAPFINYHAGINPKYRGMCGGYWALAEGDGEHFGVTVHLVDHGVDTGGILQQQVIEPAPDDNFVTYPFRLAVAGREAVLRALEEALSGRLVPIPSPLPSKQWYHPTLWSYLRTGLSRGIW